MEKNERGDGGREGEKEEEGMEGMVTMEGSRWEQMKGEGKRV